MEMLRTTTITFFVRALVKESLYSTTTVRLDHDDEFMSGFGREKEWVTFKATIAIVFLNQMELLQKIIIFLPESEERIFHLEMKLEINQCQSKNNSNIIIIVV